MKRSIYAKTRKPYSSAYKLIYIFIANFAGLLCGELLDAFRCGEINKLSLSILTDWITSLPLERVNKKTAERVKR
jgi:hypothetical protein